MMHTRELDIFLKETPEGAMVDVRSEAEFAQGHIPGSINIPLLTNEQRVQVGTLYKQLGKEAAVLKGFQLVGPQFYERFKALRKASVEHRLSIYCWRGGMRSNIMAWMMNLSDYEVGVLKGGYKAYRQYAHALFARPWKWIVLSGKTGTGKTDLLRQLALRGEQVLDFEGLAHHKGSAFGHIGQPSQPTVEYFENLLAWNLRQFDPDKPVWIENESRFLGKVRIPDALFNQTLSMPVIEVERDLDTRKRIIWDDYGRYPIELLLEATEKLSRKLGGDREQQAAALLTSGDWQGWLDILLVYYDKTYAHSGQIRTGPVRHFRPGNDMAADTTLLLHLKNQIWNQ